jgi:hypothetical protein
VRTAEQSVQGQLAQPTRAAPQRCCPPFHHPFAISICTGATGCSKDISHGQRSVRQRGETFSGRGASLIRGGGAPTSHALDWVFGDEEPRVANAGIYNALQTHQKPSGLSRVRRHQDPRGVCVCDMCGLLVSCECVCVCVCVCMCTECPTARAHTHCARAHTHTHTHTTHTQQQQKLCVCNRSCYEVAHRKYSSRRSWRSTGINKKSQHCRDVCGVKCTRALTLGILFLFFRRTAALDSACCGQHDSWMQVSSKDW